MKVVLLQVNWVNCASFNKRTIAIRAFHRSLFHHPLQRDEKKRPERPTVGAVPWVETQSAGDFEVGILRPLATGK